MTCFLERSGLQASEGISFVENHQHPLFHHYQDLFLYGIRYGEDGQPNRDTHIVQPLTDSD